MAHGLSEQQIEITLRELLRHSRRVTVREAMQALRERFGGCGRTERICRILKRLESQLQISAADVDVHQELERLRALVHQAESRAELSEERERQHQDLWAARYAEKVEELERQQQRANSRSAGVPHEQYLRVHQRAATRIRINRPASLSSETQVGTMAPYQRRSDATTTGRGVAAPTRL
jgi:uncharacterized protein YdiU (UPF0061 family)